MALAEREIVHDRTSGGSWVAWLALILAVIALIVAWMAYNRAGTDLESKIDERLNRSIDELQGQR